MPSCRPIDSKGPPRTSYLTPPLSPPLPQDSHWEVRSAACIALRSLATHFGALLAPHAPSLLPLCFTNLEDESWAIRADAAQALGALARFASSPDFEILPLLLARLRTTLPLARTQPAMTKEQAAKLFNDPARHTGQRIVGCCGGEPAQHTHANHGHKHHDHAPHQRRQATHPPIIATQTFDSNPTSSD